MGQASYTPSQEASSNALIGLQAKNIDSDSVVIAHLPNTVMPKHYHFEDKTFVNPQVPIRIPPLSDQFRIYSEILLSKQFVPNLHQLPLKTPNWAAINNPNHANVQVCMFDRLMFSLRNTSTLG